MPCWDVGSTQPRHSGFADSIASCAAVGEKRLRKQCDGPKGALEHASMEKDETRDVRKLHAVPFLCWAWSHSQPFHTGRAEGVEA